MSTRPSSVPSHRNIFARSRVQRNVRRCIAALTVGLSTACAASSPDPVVMEPMVVRAEPDPLVGLDTYDAADLFELAAERYRAERWADAAAIYEKLVDEFPDAPEVPKAHYNAGLAHERRAAFADAARHFEAVIVRHEGSAVFGDAHFNLARAYGKLERWEDVANTFWEARKLEGLGPMDELEARVGTGVGFFMQGDHFTAEREFREAVRFYEDHPKKEYLPADYFMGQSRFYLGEIIAREFEAKSLSAPDEMGTEDDWTEAMGEELESKCDLLLRAQANFIRAIREGHRGWATAAGYRIGSLYEHLFDELMSLPVPQGLDEGAADIYREEVRDRVSILVEKAIRVYEMNRAMAERIGEDNEWVQRTTAALERMKALYLATTS